MQLFDLATHPDERRDLAGDPRHAARSAALRARLAAWQRENGDRWFSAAASRAPVA